MRNFGATQWACVLAGTWALVSAAGCLEERRAATVAAVCGNGYCESGENVQSCPQDCPAGTCGNNTCEMGETPTSCPEDCPENLCGNAVCNDSENPITCPGDCPAGICGNNLCEPQESTSTCVEDCSLLHCGDHVCDMAETVGNCPQDCGGSRRVDLLVVMDDSGGTTVLQDAVADAYRLFAYRLLQGHGQFVSLHVGVVTMDLGTRSWDVPGCSDDGDGGQLGRAGGENRSETCIGPGWFYWADEPPDGCTIQMTPDGTCTQHDCTDEDCPPGLKLAIQPDTLCPRCTPLGQTDRVAMACLLRPGDRGCGFEQPLEAMRLALTDSGPQVGFLRPDSLLVILFVTNEDDCSAAVDASIFDPSDQELGPLSNYRCFRAGVTCDQPLDAPGTKTGCAPAAMGDGGLLYGVDRYLELLSQLRDPGRIMVAAYFGGRQQVVQVIRDQFDRLAVQPVCTLDQALPIYPGIRLSWLVENLSGTGNAWSKGLACANDFSSMAFELAAEIRRRLNLH